MQNVTGIGCRCIDGTHVVQDTGYYGRSTGVPSLECKLCGPNEAPSQAPGGPSFCIACPSEAQITAKGCKCPPNHILIERDLDGKFSIALFWYIF